MHNEFEKILDKFMEKLAEILEVKLAAEPAELRSLKLALAREAFQALRITMSGSNGAAVEAIKIVLRMSKLINDGGAGTPKPGDSGLGAVVSI